MYSYYYIINHCILIGVGGVNLPQNIPLHYTLGIVTIECYVGNCVGERDIILKKLNISAHKFNEMNKF